MKPFTLKKLPPLKVVKVKTKPIKKSTGKKDKTPDYRKMNREAKKEATEANKNNLDKYVKSVTKVEDEKCSDPTAKSVKIPASTKTIQPAKPTVEAVAGRTLGDKEQLGKDNKKGKKSSSLPDVQNVTPSVPVSVEPVKPKWTIPDGVLIAAALTFFVREWKAGNKDAIRLLALQSEAYGVEVPRSTDDAQLDSLLAEIFRILTKGKELTKTCESIRKLLSWPGFAGGMI